MRTQFGMQVALMVLAGVCGFTPPSLAQIYSPGGPVRGRFGAGATGTTVNVNFQINQPITGISSADERSAALEKVQRTMLDMVNHECDTLRVAFSADCRLAQVNVNSSMNLQGYPEGAPGYFNASAQGSYEITPTAAPAKP